MSGWRAACLFIENEGPYSHSSAQSTADGLSSSVWFLFVCLFVCFILSAYRPCPRLLQSASPRFSQTNQVFGCQVAMTSSSRIPVSFLLNEHDLLVSYLAELSVSDCLSLESCQHYVKVLVVVGCCWLLFMVRWDVESYPCHVSCLFSVLPRGFLLTSFPPPLYQPSLEMCVLVFTTPRIAVVQSFYTGVQIPSFIDSLNKIVTQET